jgi:hypothetical protein
MNETLINIFGIYGFINLIITYIVPLMLDADMDDKEKSFWKYVFIYQYCTYKYSKDSINTLGIIILEIIVTLCIFGSNILIFVGLSVLEIFLAICKLFCLIFKKH